MLGKGKGCNLVPVRGLVLELSDGSEMGGTPT